MTPAPQLLQKLLSFGHDRSGPSSVVVGAYYPDWSVYHGAKPSDLRLALLTHLYYAFACVEDDGSLLARDPKATFGLDVDGSKGCLAAFAKLRREQQLNFRILLSVGGPASSRFASVAADPTKIKRFCESARAIVEQHGLDGIDIDWEHPSNPGQGISFVNLLKALRTYLPSPKYTLTAALPAAQWCLENIDVACLLKNSSHLQTGPVLDHLNIMAYDFAGSWTGGQSGHHAQLFTPAKPHNAFAKRSISAVTQYLVKERGCDAKGLVIGIPSYGRSFMGVDGPGQRFTSCGGRDGTFIYSELPLAGCKEVVDREVGAASCLSKEGGWISYDCPETVRMKGAFVRSNGLGGIFFWTAANDAFSDERSLIVAGKQAMGI